MSTHDLVNLIQICSTSLFLTIAVGFVLIAWNIHETEKVILKAIADLALEKKE